MPLDFGRLSSATLAPARRGPGDHFVQLYDEDASLVEAVATFARQALVDGDAAIVVATAGHRNALADLLVADGLDLDELSRSSRFFSLDAEHVLATFLVDGRPDEAKFTAVVGGLVQEAATGGRKVRVFGEMVAVLWDRGDVAGAIALEEMWNRLAESQPFDLFCAYPASSFDEGDVSLLGEVCHRHSHVLPPR